MWLKRQKQTKRIQRENSPITTVVDSFGASLVQNAAQRTVFALGLRASPEGVKVCLFGAYFALQVRRQALLIPISAPMTWLTRLFSRRPAPILVISNPNTLGLFRLVCDHNSIFIRHVPVSISGCSSRVVRVSSLWTVFTIILSGDESCHIVLVCSGTTQNTFR